MDPMVSVKGNLSTSEQKEKVVLPKQDLDKVFRRLSMATTESLGSLTQRDDDLSVGTSRAPSMSNSSLVLPEKTVEKIFTNLSMKRTASFSMRMLQVQEDAAPTKSPIKGIKTLPEENLANMFQRLSQSTGSSVDLNETMLSGSARPPDTSSMSRTLSSSRLMNPTATSGIKYLSSHDSSGQLTKRMEAPLSNSKPLAAVPLVLPSSAMTSKVPVTAPGLASQTVQLSGGKTPTSTAGGDFFSKLEASLSLMESMKFDSPPPAELKPAALVLTAVAPPMESFETVQVGGLDGDVFPPYQQASDKQHPQIIPRNGVSVGRCTKNAAASSNSCLKKKSSEAMDQLKKLDLQQQQTADEFIENIPFITTEGSDSEEEGEEV
jgi:hypothetical protein